MASSSCWSSSGMMMDQMMLMMMGWDNNYNNKRGSGASAAMDDLYELRHEADATAAGGGGEWRKGPWTAEEDKLLTHYVQNYGEGRWNSVSRITGLRRNGKSCRLRWVNYLRPDLKRGQITPQEETIILELHARWGNRWSTIARSLPGRTDNEIKNYWRTHFKKKTTAATDNTNNNNKMSSAQKTRSRQLRRQQFKKQQQQLIMMNQHQHQNNQLLMTQQQQMDMNKFASLQLDDHRAMMNFPNTPTTVNIEASACWDAVKRAVTINSEIIPSSEEFYATDTRPSVEPASAAALNGLMWDGFWELDQGLQLSPTIIGSSSNSRPPDFMHNIMPLPFD